MYRSWTLPQPPADLPGYPMCICHNMGNYWKVLFSRENELFLVEMKMFVFFAQDLRKHDKQVEYWCRYRTAGDTYTSSVPH